MPRKAKRIHDPAAATIAALERRAREDEIARLVAQGAKVTTDRQGRVVSAYRSNVANLLLSRGTITQSHHDAFTLLANAWAAWKGLDGGPDHGGEKVDGSSGARELVTDRMIRAGREVALILGCLLPAHRALLTAFMVATVEEDRPMSWRGIVERDAGITARDRQTVLVVASMEDLRALYQEPRERAA